MHNYYNDRFTHLIGSGSSISAAVESTTLAYIDSKPATRGKHKVSSAERHVAFWSCKFLIDLPAESWQSQAMVLALAQYMGQKYVANAVTLASVAAVCPPALIQAVRFSGLVLAHQSPRRSELEQLATIYPVIAELCKVLDIFELAHRQRLSEVAVFQTALAELSPLELLSYASLYAFERLVPAELTAMSSVPCSATDMQDAWDAVNDMLVWKLGTCSDAALNLTDSVIGASLARHMSPFLFPSPSGQVRRDDLREIFKKLLAAQIELNSFINQSADAFSYDSCIEFVRIGDRLEIVELHTKARGEWQRNERKIGALHNYWFYRAMDAFARSDVATLQIGRPENYEANRAAYIKAMRTQLRLTEVYGIGATVTTDTGDTVPLFQALLSLDLMNAFFQRDFLAEYARHLRSGGNWSAALTALAMKGLIEGQQIRFPLTWSDRDTKISNMVGWTVTAVHPQGNRRWAAAIVDFWTSDWAKLASQLRDGSPGLLPELFERPILKMGKTLVQLPWLVGLQNTSTAAINNLRRLGQRRGEFGSETKRIETQLGALFKTRGFCVVVNWIPPTAQESNAGEVDLICACGGVVLILEVKSTYLRRSHQDAWLHETGTLRKAGQQLTRKIAAVQTALSDNPGFAEQLGINSKAHLAVHGWIVDTSIECDHQRFSGFLKVSLEALLIALRDDRQLLNDPDGIFSQPSNGAAAVATTLYPQGFSAVNLVAVIESQAVWDGI